MVNKKKDIPEAACFSSAWWCGVAIEVAVAMVVGMPIQCGNGTLLHYVFIYIHVYYRFDNNLISDLILFQIQMNRLIYKKAYWGTRHGWKLLRDGLKARRVLKFMEQSTAWIILMLASSSLKIVKGLVWKSIKYKASTPASVDSKY